MNNFSATAKEVGKALERIAREWDGRTSILEMKAAAFPHWRQMEWIGFYFQFLCERHLRGVVQIPGPEYGKPRFDGFKQTPWDFKAHAINTSSHQVIVNDSSAIASAIQDYGAVGLVIALGKVQYNDEDKRTFQKWHDRLKGKRSKYVLARIQRGAWSRLRKVSFDLQQISFIKITDETLVRCGSFQTGFRNAGGAPRQPKVLIDLEQIGTELVHVINFKQGASAR